MMGIFKKKKKPEEIAPCLLCGVGRKSEELGWFFPEGNYIHFSCLGDILKWLIEEHELTWTKIELAKMAKKRGGKV